jgi:hypothetical protein
MTRLPARRSTPGEIDRFLKKSRDISHFRQNQPRLLFAIDATASRQPTWDSACQQQQAMFREAARIASLRVQLCYYRGFNEFFASDWLDSTEQLGRLMGRVYCQGGHTQIARLLRHAQAEHSRDSVRAMVFIGDAVEENPDTLCNLAGQCGLRSLPLFMFQEGQDPAVERCFRQMSRVSRGAYAHFDQDSAGTLASLLGAVASFAAGGRRALENQGGESAKLLLEQLRD